MKLKAKLTKDSYQFKYVGIGTCRVILKETGEPIHTGILNNTAAINQRDYNMGTENYSNGFSFIPYC